MTAPSVSGEVLDAQATDRAILARSGALEARLALTPGEVEAAQRLRYQVFYEEMGAQPTPEMAAIASGLFFSSATNSAQS